MSGRRPRFATVRVRTTLGTSVVVGLTLAVAGVALVTLLRAGLTDNVQGGAEQRAEDVVALLDGGVMPAAVVLDDEDASLIQVLDANGAVVGSSSNLTGRPPLAELRAEEARTLERVPIEAVDPYQLVARGSSDGRFLVLVARSLESVRESTEALSRGLLVGVPILLLLVASTAWIVTGRALRPVEEIRRAVAVISAGALGRRVPQPSGADEVARLAQTMNAMLDRLEDSRDRQRRFISDASHELRSPITTIRHLLEVAIAHPERASLDVLAPEVLAEDLRLERLVGDLLLLARADEQTLVLRRRPVDLDDVVLAEASRLRRRGIVTVDTSGVGAGQLVADPVQLGRMVRNLADNAERHAASTVLLSLVAEPGRLRLTVADDGAGVAQTDRERIFERFTRLDVARTRDAGGSGLGLAIVAAVAHAHGGTVSVQARRGESGPGACFVVLLPTTDELD